MRSRKKLKYRIMDMGLRQKTVALAMAFFMVVVILSGVTFFTIYENMRIETTKRRWTASCRRRRRIWRLILTIWKAWLTA
ncbi:MAG: hypothetical protein ACLRMZ_01640 [Blautia marasmi]